MKIRNKILILLVITSLIPLLVMSSASLIYSSDLVKALSISSAQNRVAYTASELSAYFSARISEVDAYASTPTLRSMNWPQANSFLKEQVAHHSGIYEKFIIGLPDSHFHNTKVGNPAQDGLASFNDNDPDSKLKSIRKRGYWQYLVGTNANAEHRVHVSNPMVSYTTGVRQVVVGASIRKPDGTLGGMLGGAIAWQEIEKRIQALKENITKEFGEQAQISLIDSDGTYIYHEDPKMVVHLLVDENGKPVLNEIGEKTVVLHKIGDHPAAEVSSMGGLMIAGGSGHLFYEDPATKEPMAMIYAPVSSADYSIALSVPESVMLQPVAHLKWLFISIITASLLLLLLVAWPLANRSSKRIVRLESAAEQLANGNRDIRLETNGEDEIESLTESFNSLVDSLKIREQKLDEELSLRNKAEAALSQNLVELEDIVKIRTAELERTTIKAQSATVAKSQFLATMSHEIRTPMNGVMGIAELLRDTPLNDEQSEYVSTILNSADSLLVIINDILDFSKIEANQIELEKIDFDLRSVVHDVFSLLEVKANEKHIDLLVEYTKNTAHYFQGDPTRLLQVLTNLVGNAIKFTEKGYVRIRVNCESLDTSTRITIDVEDTGIGIEEGMQAHLFDSFTQADSSTTRMFGGTGLGLAISKCIVEQMDGEISIHSQLGHGSTFSVALDLPDASTEFSTTQAENLDNQYTSSIATDDHGPVFSGDILLAEDAPANQKIAIVTLEKLGLRVDLAENGAEAINLAKRQTYDLIFMDCRMPVIDGYEATKRIRTEGQNRQTPIIALTANATVEDRRICLDTGMDDVVTKPFRRKHIVNALAQWMPGPEKTDRQSTSIESAINQNTIANLKQEMGEDFAELLSTSKQSLNEAFESFGEDLTRLSCSEIADIAHTLKSISAYMGATQLTESLQSLESDARSEHIDNAAQRLLDLKAEYERVADALNRIAS